MNKLIIVCMMCLAVVYGASAGYTDSLWNESEARVYYDCGDWSGVDNHKSTSLNGDFYCFRRHVANSRYLFTPTNWGYPADAKLKRVGSDDMAWTCIHIFGFDKTLNVDEEVYTDDPTKINYKTSYLQYIGWSTQHWHTYKIENDVEINSFYDAVEIKNSIIFYSKRVYGDGDIEYKKIHSTPKDSIKYNVWGSVNSTIKAELINHSNYMILNVPTPEDITGIKITATSKNTTAIYEKHTHCLKLNTSKSFMTCDLVDCKYHDFAEITPFGHDSYLLKYEPDYIINVTLYTPFESIDAVVTVNDTDAEPIRTDLKYDTVWDLLYIAVPISLIIGLTRLI